MKPAARISSCQRCDIGSGDESREKTNVMREWGERGDGHVSNESVRAKNPSERARKNGWGKMKWDGREGLRK